MRPQRTVLIGRIAPRLVIVGDPPKVQLGHLYSFTFSVQGSGSGKYIFTEAGALPAGIAFTDNANGTCTIAGTTTASGAYPFTLTVVDTVNGYKTGPQAYVLDAPPLSLQLLESAPVIRGIAVAGIALIASGGYGGYTYPLYTLPTGLSVNSVGTIIGTCTDTVGIHACSAKVMDSSGANKTITFNLEVHSRLAALNVSPAAMQIGVVVAYMLSVSNATGVVTWTLTSGTLPPGVAITGGNTLSGTPTTAGTYTSTLTATDSGTGDTLPVSFVLVVSAPASGNFKSAPEYVLSAGTNYPQLPLAADVAGGVAAVFGVPPYTYTFDAAYAPGIVGDPATGFLTGTPLTPRVAYWSAGGSMTAGRQIATATLLVSGKVLLVGGNNGSYLNSTELYDPAGNSWSAGGAMTNARAFHASTILQSGKVLTTGGFNGAMLNQCELYDPAANTWGSGGVMTGVRNQHTATLLNTGKVLVVAGDNLGTPVNTCELYNNVANTWSSAGVLTTARTQHTATLLANGKVLVCGGSDVGGAALASCQIYDPGTNTWGAAAAMSQARFFHTATLLNNGKVLVAGGSSGIASLSSCELYDPVSNTWSAAAALNTGRKRHSATLLLSGELLVTGGQPSTGAVLGTAEIYNPVYNAWNIAGRMAFSRYYLTSTLMSASGKVLIAGGLPSFPKLAELFEPGLKITVTDSLGVTATQYVALTVNRPNPSLQHKLNSVPVGATSTASVNYSGSGVSDVTNDGNTAEVVLVPYAVAAGTNTYTATLSPAPLQYATNATYKIKFTNANTGASTLELNGLGAAAIQLKGAALAAGQIPAGSTLDVFYNGATFQIVGVPGLGGTVTGVTATSPITSSGGTTPDIALAAATAFAPGYLLSSDWNTFNNKQQAITFAAVGSVPNANGGTLSAGVLTLQPANASFPGVLKAADWTTFNNKQAAPTVTTATGNLTLNQAGWNIVFVNATGLTITLPAAPNIGDEVDFVCAAAAVALTVNPNALKIETTAGNMTCDLKKPNGSVMNFTMIYTNATEGWSLI
jgi:hypothetical protein